jgi:beta-mannosidase
MHKLQIIIISILTFLTACHPEKELPIITALDSNWSFRTINSKTSHPATVPGNIYSDLIDNSIIEDPFIGDNEFKLQWVSDSTWIYQTRFDVSSTILNKENIDLNFEGLDTYAQVYLNDSLILSSNNAFRNYKVPVKDFVLLNNSLSIKFTPTHIKEEIEKNKLGYTLPEGRRIFTRKAQFQYGWDWGPSLNTIGIWKGVSLNAWNDAKIEHVFLKKKSYTKDQAKITAKITLSDPPKEPTLIVLSIAGKDFSLPIQAGNEKKEFDVPLTIDNPKFWWPHNLGEPYLYEVDIKLRKGAVVTDNVKVNHGVRNVSLISDDDQYGQSFYFMINGIPVYMKGANYIPQHSLQNRVTDAHYENLLQDVVDANMNMLRVWGGGIYENNIFYDLCDRKGILVWQDFMYACAMYPGDEPFLRNAEKEAEDQLLRLRNHPSIVLFCGNNENSEGWHRWGWQNGKTKAQKDKIWADYLKLFDSILPNQVAKYTDVDYWESSPKYGRGNPKYQSEGDAHDWWVWHDAYPFEHFEDFVPRFMSEFGFQSFPSADVMKFINQSDDIQIDTKAIRSHQKHHRGFELIDLYIGRDYLIPDNDEDYIFLSQLVQARGMRIGIEAHRRAKPYNMGTLYWQLNDCWPGISWSSIDHFGNWKALHYEAKDAFENVLISFERHNDRVNVYIVNDLITSLDESLEMKLIDFDGNVLWSASKQIKVPSSSSNLVNSFSIDSGLTSKWNQVLLQVNFGNSTSTYFFVKPKELALKNNEIEFDVEKVNEGYLISMSSISLQKGVMLSTTAKGHFSDNYFDLYPNEIKQVLFKTEASSVGKLLFNCLNKVFDR